MTSITSASAEATRQLEGWAREVARLHRKQTEEWERITAIIDEAMLALRGRPDYLVLIEKELFYFLPYHHSSGYQPGKLNGPKSNPDEPEKDPLIRQMLPSVAIERYGLDRLINLLNEAVQRIDPATGELRNRNVLTASVDMETRICRLPINSYTWNSVGTAVRKWFRLNRDDPRSRPQDFTLADLLQVPLTYLQQHPKVMKSHLRNLTRWLNSQGLELKSQEGGINRGLEQVSGHGFLF